MLHADGVEKTDVWTPLRALVASLHFSCLRAYGTVHDFMGFSGTPPKQVFIRLRARASLVRTRLRLEYNNERCFTDLLLSH